MAGDLGAANARRVPKRDVLFVAYYFPPFGGGGVQRSLEFCRYLPEFGYAPVVLTRPDAPPVDWTPPDASLTERIPATTEVVRVEGPEPDRTTGLQSRAVRWLRVDEPFARWWRRSMLEAARPLAARTDLIYVSMSPFEGAPVAAQLARESGKPWIADLRDPWALDEWLEYPTAVHRRLELRLMARALASATAIVMNTPEATRRLLRRFPEFQTKRVVTIPNGFDSSSFVGPVPPRTDGAFRIVHAGHVHTAPAASHARFGRRLLGGTAPGLETSTRSHENLIAAIDGLLARRPELASTIEVHLAGALSERDLATLPGYVRAHGYLAHGEAIRLLRSSDLLFLPMHDLAPGFRSSIVPGKTYEYLAAGTPILGAVPDGDARDLLTRAGNALLCRPNDVAAIARAVEEAVEMKRRGDVFPPPRAEIISSFDRRALTLRLAELFDEITFTTSAPATGHRVAVG